MSDVKRWQFTLRGILGYTTLVAVAIASWQIGFFSTPDNVEESVLAALAALFAIVFGAGVIGATTGWLTSGSSSGFWYGFWLFIFLNEPSLTQLKIIVERTVRPMRASCKNQSRLATD